MKRVILESPYAGDVEKNLAYAREALKHSLSCGESPLASHLLYTQVLDDASPNERLLGIEAGYDWLHVAQGAVFYMDLGLSPGMILAIKAHQNAFNPIVFRWLRHPPKDFLAIAKQYNAKSEVFA